MPIHNEEKFLPYSLPSVYRLKPNDVVLIFDSCKDKSLELARRIAKIFDSTSKTRFIKLNEPSPDWNFRVAFVRRYGFRLAKNDVILNTDADNILDPKIRKYMALVKKNNIGLISFSRRSYPYTVHFFMAKLISILPLALPFRKIGFSGVYAFSKEAWRETEEKSSVKKILKAEDSHLHRSMLQNYDYRYIKTDTIHLRPRNARKNYLAGIMYRRLKRNPLWKAILHSIIYLRPDLLVGYLHAKHNRVQKHKMVK